MNEQTIRLDNPRGADVRVEQAHANTPTWWVVFLRELSDLWVGGKAPVLLLLFSVVLGVQSFVIASNSELSLMPPNEMVYETLKIAISVGLFIGLIIGADSISGERERATLETLLLTPTSRLQIIIGKFLAALTPWPVAFVLALPYMSTLGQGDPVFGQSIPWGALVGTLLVVCYTGLGMFVSYWCNTNRTSYFVCLGIYILVLLPAQLPGTAQTGAMGQFLQWINPLAAGFHFLSKILVNNRTFEEWRTWLIPACVFGVVIVGLLFALAARNLPLEAGKEVGRFRPKFGRTMSLLALVGVCAALALQALMAPAAAALAHKQPQAQQNQESPLKITIDMEYLTVKTSDSIVFKTDVTNVRDEAARPVIVAMNIINLNKEGDVVDPEDWSPERTQYVTDLTPGKTETLAWRVNAILEGDYLIYMVAMPEPAGAEATSTGVASQGIHLTVTPFTKLNPAGILPLAIGVPLVIGGAIAVTQLLRRRKIDTGAVKDAGEQKE
jgi:ABC-2 type transport system permease protein